MAFTAPIFTKRHFFSQFLVNLTCTQFFCALPHYCAVLHRSTAPSLSTVRSSPKHDTSPPPFQYTRSTGRSNQQHQFRVFIWISDYTAPSLCSFCTIKGKTWQRNVISIWRKTAKYKRKLVEKFPWVEVNFKWKLLGPDCCTANTASLCCPALHRDYSTANVLSLTSSVTLLQFLI